jgi:hypothetical protein
MADAGHETSAHDRRRAALPWIFFSLAVVVLAYIFGSSGLRQSSGGVGEHGGAAAGAPAVETPPPTGH